MSISSSKPTDGPRFQTLLQALAAAPPERPFVTMWAGEDQLSTVTFGEFTKLAQTQAQLFASKGLRARDTVIIIMPQGIVQMAAFVGAMMLGAVPAILAYPNFKVDPAKYRFGLAGVSANLKAKLIVLDSAFPEDVLSHVKVGEGSQLVRSVDSAGAGATSGLPPVPCDPHALAFIQHSAGTTGLQKGVALSHSAVLTQLHHLTGALHVTQSDRVYSWLPLYHDMGLIACFMLPLAYHLPVVMQSPTDWVIQPGTMLQLISDHQCTLAWVPNFTLQFLARRVHEDDRPEFELSSLRAIVNCSEPVRAQSMDEFLAAYPVNGVGAHVLQSSYGMAENVFAITQSIVDGKTSPQRVTVDPDRLRQEHVAAPLIDPGANGFSFVSSGRCLPGNEVRVVAEAGHDLADGHIGEIYIRSDSLFDGYYNRPDLTEKVLLNGWYKTGDLGFQLEGELYVIGRKKDLIIVAGKNIYPQDVEEIVCAHPSIHDGRAVAMGVYNPDLGTEDIVVVAEVDKEEQLADSLNIERAVRNAIVAELGVAARAVYLKPPRWIVKSTAGKPARSTTRDKLMAEHPELAPDPAGDAGSKST